MSALDKHPEPIACAPVVQAHNRLGCVSITVPGKPLAFARAGTNGTQRFTPKPQAAYMEAVGYAARSAMAKAGYQPFAGAVELIYRATFAYPDGWREKYKIIGAWKTSKSDTSNLVKLAEDAMIGVVFVDDAQVVRITADKRYGLADGVVITIQELDGSETAQ